MSMQKMQPVQRWTYETSYLKYNKSSELGSYRTYNQ